MHALTGCRGPTAPLYEIDQQQVIEFKSRTLAELGAQPTAFRRAVAADLRDDWTAALAEAGFDPDQPSAWSAEGLLGYLPPDAQDRLLDTITRARRAAGSRLRKRAHLRARARGADQHWMRTVSQRWQHGGLDLDMTELVYFGDRNEAAVYLSDHGWQMGGSTIRELFAANGLPLDRRRRPAVRRPSLRQRNADRQEIGAIRCHGATTTAAGIWPPSVGATATMVATSRALASRGPEPLLDDPFAEPLVRAVGLAPFVRILDGGSSASKDDPMLNRKTRTEQMAVRTRFFDDFFTGAAATGVRQAVILASGLDTRAYRLPWPDGHRGGRDRPTAGDRLQDQHPGGLGAAPTAERRTVAIDLRDDWPTALRSQSGFDVTQPTAWSAEGLLAYLPPEAQDRLFDNITALSAPGSQLATEHISDPNAFPTTRATDQRAVAPAPVSTSTLADLFYHR